jgi:hypothetical protein
MSAERWARHEPWVEIHEPWIDEILLLVWNKTFISKWKKSWMNGSIRSRMTFIKVNVIRHHTTGKTMIDKTCHHFEIFNMVLIFCHHCCRNDHHNGHGYHNSHAILSAKTILGPFIAYSLSHSSASEELWHHRRVALQHTSF